MKINEGKRLFVTSKYAFNYSGSHLGHMVQFEILSQFFEHRNGLEGYVSDEDGGRIEEGSDIDILLSGLYEAFDNKRMPEAVKEILLHYEMYEILKDYNEDDLCPSLTEFKQNLITGKYEG